jgi:hypothetical protein
MEEIVVDVNVCENENYMENKVKDGMEMNKKYEIIGINEKRSKK